MYSFVSEKVTGEPFSLRKILEKSREFSKAEFRSAFPLSFGAPRHMLTDEVNLEQH
jgi:hypothetical protein